MANGAMGSRALIRAAAGVSEGLRVDKEGFFGDVDTAAATGAVTTTDNLMAYVKQIVTAIVAGNFSTATVEAILGALDTAAATGAVTTTDTLTAYIKQLVTAAIADGADIDTILANTDNLESVLGALATAQHAGAVDAVTTVMGYVKQLVAARIAADIVQAAILVDTGTDIPATITTLTANLATLQAELSGAAGLVSFPAGAAAANAVSVAEVLRYVQDQLLSLRAEISQAAGIVAFPAAADPANGVSMAEVIRRIFGLLRGGVGHGADWPAETFPAADVGLHAAYAYGLNAIRKSGGGALAASKSLVDALGSDGSALLYGSGSALGAIGTRFSVSGNVLSENIFTTSVDLTDVSTGGDIYIEEILLETDSSGLINGTDIEFRTNEAYGLALIGKTTVAKLGPNKTIRLSVDGETGFNFKGLHLSTGKKLTINSTVQNCLLLGIMRVTLQCHRIGAGAGLSISAAIGI